MSTEKKKERKKTRTYLCIQGSRNQTSFQQQRQAITPIFPVQDYANVYNYYLGKILLQEKWTNKQKSRGGEFFFSLRIGISSNPCLMPLPGISQMPGYISLSSREQQTYIIPQAIQPLGCPVEI